VIEETNKPPQRERASGYWRQYLRGVPFSSMRNREVIYHDEKSPARSVRIQASANGVTFTIYDRYLGEVSPSAFINADDIAHLCDDLLWFRKALTQEAEQQ
jgi:hypothetical protein